MDLYSWKYKFYDIKDNQIKDCKIFSPYTQFKNKGFEFMDVKKTKKYHVFIDDQNKNIVCSLNWKRYVFDFDAHFRDLNLIFVFDHTTKTFLTNYIFIKAATIVNDKYLKYGKNFDINAFFTDWFVSKGIGLYPREKQGNGVVIGSYEGYQKLPANEKYLMPLIQTNNRLYICQGAIFFTCLKEFKTGKFINRRQHFRTLTISNYLAQLRRKFKRFSLTLFDEWKYERDTTTTWHKNDIQQILSVARILVQWIFKKCHTTLYKMVFTSKQR